MPFCSVYSKPIRRLKITMDKSPRRYPPLYERLLPIALAVIGLLILILLALTVAVALRWIQWT
jgi:hypothetical protein